MPSRGKLVPGVGGLGPASPPSLALSLQDCTYGTEIISKWKNLLENDQLLSHGGQDLSTDAFHRSVRRAPGSCCCLLGQEFKHSADTVMW